MKQLFFISLIFISFNSLGQTNDFSTQLIEDENFNLQTINLELLNTLNFSENQNTNSDKSSIKYRMLLEIGHQFGVGEYKLDRFNLDVTNGIIIDRSVFLGIGSGIRYKENYSVLPIYFQARTMNLDKKSFPYFSIAVGYGVDLNGFLGLGMYFKPSVGINIKEKDKNIVNIGLCFDSQHIPERGYLEAHAAKAIGIEFGYSF